MEQMNSNYQETGLNVLKNNVLKLCRGKKSND